MRQSDITPGIYESRDGMVRTVVRVENGFVDYHPNHDGSGPIRRQKLSTFATWSARRKADLRPTNLEIHESIHGPCRIPMLPMRPYAGDVLGGAEVQADWHLVQTPAVREAWASCALDGETMSLEECRICRCTEDRACVTRHGPCGWAEPGLCTGCVDRRPPGRVLRVKKGDMAIVAPGTTEKRHHWHAACGAPGCLEVARLADFTANEAPVLARKSLGWTISRKRGRGWVCAQHGVPLKEVAP